MDIDDELQGHGLDGDLDDTMPMEPNAETYDEHYLDVDEAAINKIATANTGEVKILHSTGISRLKRKYSR
jgi:hypothetical protein